MPTCWSLATSGSASVAGRLLGSVPSEVSRRAKIDVLIVHTAD